VEANKNIPLTPFKGGIRCGKPFKGGIMGDTPCYFAIRKFVEISKNIL
jgi:hypothetical protein